MKDHESSGPQHGGFIAPEGPGWTAYKPLMRKLNANASESRDGMAWKNFMIRVSSVLICGFLTGCAAYNRSALTPDSFNYTVAVDDSPMRVDQHWFGFSWQLKKAQ